MNASSRVDDPVWDDREVPFDERAWGRFIGTFLALRLPCAYLGMGALPSRLCRR
jgi:hypothetical protein